MESAAKDSWPSYLDSWQSYLEMRPRDVSTAYAIAAHAIAAATMMFIPPKDTGTRFAAVVTIAALCFRAIAAIDRSTDEGSTEAEYMFGFILHANCHLVLLQLAAPKTGKTLWERLRWAAVALTTPRRKLRRDQKRMSYQPSKLTFVTLRVLQVMVLGAALEYIGKSTLFLSPIDHADVTSGKESLVIQLLHGTFTRRDLLVRADMTLKSLLVPALLLTSYHAFFSAFAVGLFDSDPAEWPPLFGNIVDAWSVGRWYSHFWQKLMRKAFTMNAAYITSKVFGLRPSSTWGRSCIVMLCFAMSGLMHTIAGWTPGPCASWMPMWTYLATGVVILLERGVQTQYARLVHGRKGLGWKWKKWEVLGWRLFGYCWVVLFFLEVLPWAIIPSMRCEWAEAGQTF